MKIVLFMTWEGTSLQKYDEVRKLVDWDNKIPKGAVLHIASSDSKGLRIVDVWESEADLNNFVENRLMPKVKEAGIETPPKVEIYPVHNLFTPGI